MSRSCAAFAAAALVGEPERVELVVADELVRVRCVDFGFVVVEFVRVVCPVLETVEFVRMCPEDAAVNLTAPLK